MPNFQHKNGRKCHQRSNLEWYYIQKLMLPGVLFMWKISYVLVSETAQGWYYAALLIVIYAKINLESLKKINNWLAIGLGLAIDYSVCCLRTSLHSDTAACKSYWTFFIGVTCTEHPAKTSSCKCTSYTFAAACMKHCSYIKRIHQIKLQSNCFKCNGVLNSCVPPHLKVRKT